MKFVSEIENLHFYNAGKKVLRSFVKGVYETSDEKEIALLLHKVPDARLVGAEIVDDGNVGVENEEPPAEKPVVLGSEEIEKMSLKQLKDYAKEQKIDMPSSVRSKREALKIIEGE